MEQSKSTPQWMWSLVTNRAAPIPVRESVLIRLAHKQVAGVLTLCDTLLASGCAEEWFMGIRGLAALGSDEALQRLLFLCVQCEPEKRDSVLRLIARVLTFEHAVSFTRLLEMFSKDNEPDTAGWTAAAVLVFRGLQKHDNNPSDLHEDELSSNFVLDMI